MTKEKQFGIAAEFDGPTELMKAAKEFRKRNYTNYETYSPFSDPWNG